MAADARRYVRAERSPLRRHRLGQLPSGAQRIGRAVHGGALRGGAPPAGRGRPVLPVAAAAPARSRDPAQHRAVVPDRLPRRLGDAREQQPGDAGAGSGRARRRGPVRRRRDPRSPGARRAARSRWRASGWKTSSRCWAASSRARRRLQRFAGDAAANTDDHPVVAYRAPRITYAPDSQPARPADRAAARAVDRAAPSS